MELYNFLRGTLAWTATIAGLWPLNIPLVALAYKIQNGPKAIEMEKQEFWLRSTFAALCVAVLTIAAVIVDYIITGMEFPAGPIHLAIFMAYIPAAVWILFLFFALDDLTQASTVLLFFVYMPAIVLYVLNWITGLWDPLLGYANSWLKVPT